MIFKFPRRCAREQQERRLPRRKDGCREPARGAQNRYHDVDMPVFHRWLEVTILHTEQCQSGAQPLKHANVAVKQDGSNIHEQGLGALPKQSNTESSATKHAGVAASPAHCLNAKNATRIVAYAATRCAPLSLICEARTWRRCVGGEQVWHNCSALHTAPRSL